MFKAIANWFKGLFGKAEQQVAKDSQIQDSWNDWKNVVVNTPTAQVEEVKPQEFPTVAQETVAPAKKASSRKKATSSASKTSKTTKTSTKTSKTSKTPAQKAAPKSKTTKTTK